jgi:ATP-dependent helicase/nuclease subunit A
VDDSELTESPAAANEPVVAPLAFDEATIKKVSAVLDWQYPFTAASQRAAKTSVTALRQQADELDDEAAQSFQSPRFQRPSLPQEGRGPLGAVDTGVAHHKFLQYFSFERAMDLKSFAKEARRLERENYLSADETAALDLEALAEFWNSETGQKFRVSAVAVRRELPFTASFSPAELDDVLGRTPDPKLKDEFVIVQGIADLAALFPNEIWLMDFKTDAVRAKELPEKVEHYSPQLKLYARALEKIYSRPVTHCWLHFLSARKTVPVSLKFI